MDAKLRRQLERIPPKDLSEFLDVLQKHSYSAHLDAHHSVHSILSAGASCSKTDLIVLSGRDETLNTGKAKILIDPLLCAVTIENLPGTYSLVMVREPNFVATPVSNAPVFVTVQSSSTRQEATEVLLQDRTGNNVDQTYITDVEIDVAAWKPDGTAAGKTSFAWICTIEAARQLMIGG